MPVGAPPVYIAQKYLQERGLPYKAIISYVNRYTKKISEFLFLTSDDSVLVFDRLPSIGLILDLAKR